MEKNTIDGPTARQLHIGIHNSMDHTPEVHNQSIHKRIMCKIQIQLIDDEDLNKFG